MKNFEYTVSLATQEDISEIILINQENLVSGENVEKEKHRENNGFIYTLFSSDELNNMVEDGKKQILQVCKYQKQVVGYVISYDFLSLPPVWLNYAEISSESKKIINTKQGLYHRQIARKINYPGVGSQLLQAVIKLAEMRNDQFIVCDIAHRPLKNIPSIAMHEKFGFKHVGQHVKHEREMGVYLKTLSAISSD